MFGATAYLELSKSDGGKVFYGPKCKTTHERHMEKVRVNRQSYKYITHFELFVSNFIVIQNFHSLNLGLLVMLVVINDTNFSL